MLFALEINNGKVVLLKLFQPSSQVSLRVLEIIEPLQGSTIGAEGEMVTQEVQLKMFGDNHDRAVPYG